jgi:hypothetical protein
MSGLESVATIVARFESPKSIAAYLSASSSGFNSSVSVYFKIKQESPAALERGGSHAQGIPIDCESISFPEHFRTHYRKEQKLETRHKYRQT